MKVICLGNNKLKNFIKISVIFPIFLFTLGFLLYLVYFFSSINFYNNIIKIIIFLVGIVFTLFILSIIIVLYTYNKKIVSKRIAKFSAYSIKFIRPFLIFLADLFKMNNEEFKYFFIELNNIIVNCFGLKFKSKDILVILPHCLQEFDCVIKVTGDAKRCKKCGKCSLAEIIETCENLNVAIEIVTGGTAARNIVKRYMPKLIVSVACERDLLSGIIDVRIIPILGIVNNRPNGPCFNTNVDVNIFKENLKKVVKGYPKNKR